MHVGIEGGTTGSKAVLVTENGEVLSYVEGPHTNHWMIGMSECVARLKTLVEQAKSLARFPQNERLTSLGLSLSGADSPSVCERIRKAALDAMPDVAEYVHVCNDTVGSMATATDQGGVCVISGTGSICKLIRSDYSFVRVGGWGYQLGDEGSAYWIAFQAMKAWIDVEEGLVEPENDITCVKQCIYEHFGIEHRSDLLNFFYSNFDKSFIAKLCIRIGEAARKGDPLCQKLYRQAGYVLARHVATVAPFAEQKSLEQPGGLSILCVGQVWKSWDLLKEGFREGLKPTKPRDISIPEFTLMRLEMCAGFGAACISAKLMGKPIKCVYERNASIFYQEKVADLVTGA